MSGRYRGAVHAEAVPEVCCNSCGCVLRGGRRFVFKLHNSEIIRCFWCCFRYRPMLRRSLMASVIVGTLLTLLNQGDILFSGSWDSALYWKIPLTFGVPFCVATWGALSNARS